MSPACVFSEQAASAHEIVMDILDSMKEPPADVDLHNAQIIVFDYTGKKSMPSASTVIFDDSEYYEPYKKDEILKLVENRKIQGIVIESEKLTEMLMRLLDSFEILRSTEATEEEKMRLSNKIYDLLEPMRVI